jgi:hypothetical protein
MLVDIVVYNHEVIAAKPTKEEVPPIILIRAESGCILPAIKWNRDESYSWAQRFKNRMFGRLKHSALKEAFRIVRDNGGLDISG